MSTTTKDPVIKLDKEPAYPVGKRVMKVAHPIMARTIDGRPAIPSSNIPIGNKGTLFESNHQYVRVRWDGYPTCRHEISTERCTVGCNTYWYPSDALICLIPIEE